MEGQRQDTTRGAWARSFLDSVCRDTAAAKAWREIEGRGIAGAAAELLFEYASAAGQIHRVRKIARRAADLAALEARAARVAKGRKNDARAEMFAQRAAEAEEKAYLGNSFPALLPPGRRFLDSSALPPGRRSIVLAKIGDNMRRYDAKPLLLALRDYAQKRGLAIGWGSLGALAACARPDSGAAEDIGRALRRFARMPHVAAARQKLLARFEADFLARSGRQ